MPVYEYVCPYCNSVNELIQRMGEEPKDVTCVSCGSLCYRKISAPARLKFVEKERLPLGSGARGKFISHEETGGSDILIPSWGAMEKEEVDYVAEVALDNEKHRKRRDTETKRKLQEALDLAYQTKQGERAKTIKEFLGK